MNHLRTILALFIGLSLTAGAATNEVIFQFQNFVGTAASNRKVAIYFPPAPTSDQVALVSKDWLTFRTDDTGSLTVTNMHYGWYQVELQQPPATSQWLVSIPDTNGVYYANLLTITGTNNAWPPPGYAWTIPASDARYAFKGEGGSGTNVLPANVITQNYSGTITGAAFYGDNIWLGGDTGIGVYGTNGYVTFVDSAGEQTDVYGSRFIGRGTGGGQGPTLNSQFIGDGSGLTNLLSTNLTGTIDPMRLPAAGITSANLGAVYVDNDTILVGTDGRLSTAAVPGGGAVQGSNVIGQVSSALGATYATNDPAGNPLASTNYVGTYFVRTNYPFTVISDNGHVKLVVSNSLPSLKITAPYMMEARSTPLMQLEGNYDPILLTLDDSFYSGVHPAMNIMVDHNGNTYLNQTNGKSINITRGSYDSVFTMSQYGDNVLSGTNFQVGYDGAHKSNLRVIGNTISDTLYVGATLQNLQYVKDAGRCGAWGGYYFDTTVNEHTGFGVWLDGTNYGNLGWIGLWNGPTNTDEYGSVNFFAYNNNWYRGTNDHGPFARLHAGIESGSKQGLDLVAGNGNYPVGIQFYTSTGIPPGNAGSIELAGNGTHYVAQFDAIGNLWLLGSGIQQTNPLGTNWFAGPIYGSAAGLSNFPVATASVPGVVYPDGTTITVDGTGKLTSIGGGTNGPGGGSTNAISKLYVNGALTGTDMTNLNVWSDSTITLQNTNNGKSVDVVWKVNSILGSQVSGNIAGQAGTVASISGNSVSSSQVTTGLGYTPLNKSETNNLNVTKINVGGASGVSLLGTNGVLSVQDSSGAPGDTYGDAFYGVGGGVGSPGSHFFGSGFGLTNLSSSLATNGTTASDGTILSRTGNRTKFITPPVVNSYSVIPGVNITVVTNTSGTNTSFTVAAGAVAGATLAGTNIFTGTNTYNGPVVFNGGATFNGTGDYSSFSNSVFTGWTRFEGLTTNLLANTNLVSIGSPTGRFDTVYLQGTNITTLFGTGSGGGQPASLNLTNWAQLQTNILGALPYQSGSANGTNWAQLQTNVLSSLAYQGGSANGTNWAQLTTNILGTLPYQSGAANLTNWSQFNTNGNVPINVAGSAASITGTYSGAVAGSQVSGATSVTNGLGASGQVTEVAVTNALAATLWKNISGNAATATTALGGSFPYTAITNAPWTTGSGGAATNALNAVLTNNVNVGAGTVITQLNFVDLGGIHWDSTIASGVATVQASVTNLGTLTAATSTKPVISVNDAYQMLSITTDGSFTTNNAIYYLTSSIAGMTLQNNVSGTAATITGTYAGAVAGSQVTGATTVTNGLAPTSYVQTATNGFVTATVTNGLAPTSYVQTATNGFVGAGVTNGLAPTTYVTTATNDLYSTLNTKYNNSTNIYAYTNVITTAPLEINMTLGESNFKTNAAFTFNGFTGLSTSNTFQHYLVHVIADGTARAITFPANCKVIGTAYVTNQTDIWFNYDLSLTIKTNAQCVPLW
jgi:hypothetical protein